MRRPFGALATLVCAALALPGCLPGQEHHEGGEPAFHKNHLSIIPGGTTEFAAGLSSTHFSLGLDYERRLSELVGLGAGGEWVFGGESREALVGVLLSLHPVGGLALSVGPGLEFAREITGVENSGTETRLGLRVGGLYTFVVGRRYALAPILYVDFFKGKDPTLVWGVAIGTLF